jgi:hypothetical protein
MANKKQEIVTFKVDRSLSEIIKAIPNRSEFIRAAVLAALQNTCPLCLSTGVLTPEKKKHWDRFLRDHKLEECMGCHEVQIVCENKPKEVCTE